MSDIPAPEISAAGTTTPTDADIYNGLMLLFNNALGGALTQSPVTPQGQLCTSLAQAISQCYTLFAYTANMFNPEKNEGVWQDGIGRIYFLERKAALPTTVTLACSGAVGTVINVGAQAADNNGNIYVALQSKTIPSGGSVDVLFQNQKTGPIACPANSVTRIFRSINGWTSVNNANAGVIGRDVETRAEFEQRRKDSVAANSNGMLESIYGAVFNIPDVVDVYATQNQTLAPIEVGSTDVELPVSSIYIAVRGGDDGDIALAISQKKGSPCPMVGNTTVSVPFTSMGSLPYPTYPITFQRPTEYLIKFSVDIVSNSQLPSNIVSLIQSAIIATFNGTNGAAREHIGQTVFASRYVGAVIAVNSAVQVITLLVGHTTAYAETVEVGIDQYPVYDIADIDVNLI